GGRPRDRRRALGRRGARGAPAAAARAAPAGQRRPHHDAQGAPPRRARGLSGSVPLAPALLLLFAGAAPAFTPQALWDAWPERRFVATSAPCLRHAELGERLRALLSAHPGRLSLESAGRS